MNKQNVYPIREYCLAIKRNKLTKNKKLLKPTGYASGVTFFSTFYYEKFKQKLKDQYIDHLSSPTFNVTFVIFISSLFLLGSS